MSGAGPHRLEAGLEPDPLLGGAGAGEVGVVLVLLHLQQVRRGVLDGRARRAAGSVQSMRSAAFSAVGTSSGFTSYAETQVTSSWTGSGASSTGRVVIRAATRATATAVSATRTASSGVSIDPGGEAPRAAVHDPDREAEVLGVAGALRARRRAPRAAGSGPARSGSRRGSAPSSRARCRAASPSTR